MSAISVLDGVNPDTTTVLVNALALTGTVNGHTVSFQPSHTSILIPGIEVLPEINIKEKNKVSPEKQTSCKLPNRRGGFNQTMKMEDGTKFHLRTGEFTDGTLGEIFIDTAKEGTFARSMLNSFAIAVSVGLQHGVPLQVFVDQFRNFMFEPKGIVNGSAVVEQATSILDAIFHELDEAYPGGKTNTPAPVRRNPEM